MRTNDSGVLVLDEWFEAIDKLPPKQYKQIIITMYLVQRKGEEVPEFEGKSEPLAKIIFPHICRRISKPRAKKSVLESVYGLDPETAKLQEVLLRKTKEMQEWNK